MYSFRCIAYCIISTFVYHIGGAKRSINVLALDNGDVSGAATSCKCHHRVCNYN